MFTVQDCSLRLNAGSLSGEILQVGRPPNNSATSSGDRYGNVWWSGLRIWLQQL